MHIDTTKSPALDFCIRMELPGRWGGRDDLATRHLLEDELDAALREAEVGWCDGGSIGSGWMEIFCYSNEVRHEGLGVIKEVMRRHELLGGCTIDVTDLTMDDPQAVVLWPDAATRHTPELFQTLEVD